MPGSLFLIFDIGDCGPRRPPGAIVRSERITLYQIATYSKDGARVVPRARAFICRRIPEFANPRCIRGEMGWGGRPMQPLPGRSEDVYTVRPASDGPSIDSAVARELLL